MVTKKFCIICKQSDNCEKIDSYKHKWYYCLSCKNIFSEQKKSKPFFEKLIAIKLVNIICKITNNERLKKLLFSENITGSQFYDYGDALKNEIYNKWDAMDDDFIKYIKKNNIDLKNKSILSVSDEPGFIGPKLKKYTNNIVFTAFNEDSAKQMSEKIGIKTLKYDLNTDYINKLTDQKFDLIFYRSCLNFSLNLEKIVDEISSISNPNSIIILSITLPSISSCLMWMFDDYTLLSFINNDYLCTIFEKKKFNLIKKDITSFNPRKYYYDTVAKKIFYYPFYLFYLIKFIIDKKKNNYHFKIDKFETSHTLMFKKIN